MKTIEQTDLMMHVIALVGGADFVTQSQHYRPIMQSLLEASWPALAGLLWDMFWRIYWGWRGVR